MQQVDTLKLSTTQWNRSHKAAASEMYWDAIQLVKGVRTLAQQSRYLDGEGDVA